MRPRAIAAAALALSIGCGPKQVPASADMPALQARLAAADELVRVGCFDCLTDALRTYEAVRTTSAAPQPIVEAATAAAIRTATLLDLRQRELGMVDDGYLQRARDAAAVRMDLRDAFATVFDFVDTVSWRISEAQPVSDDVMLDRARRMGASRDAWKERFRATAGRSTFDAYVWLAFGCASGEALKNSAENILAPIAALADAPGLTYKRATCPAIDVKALTALLDRDPRFVEANYLVGVQSILRGRLDDAERYLQRAYAWHRRWPAVTSTLASVAITAEEFDRALGFYDETLQLAPGERGAMLGRVKCLSYLSRHEDAVRAADRILEGRWNRGDAYYWRAWNLMQLDRQSEAWNDVEESWKLWRHSDVAKLAGMIAYRRQQLDVAREKFDTGYKMNHADCEGGFYLGIVEAEQGGWPATADTFTSVAGCLERARQRATDDIAELQVSTLSPERKARQIAKREQQIRTIARMLATSWFNTAVAYFNLSRKTEAREYAERVSDDAQFGVRARELLARLR
jgi:tetratricopeptide (TPR) repeat protein